MEVRMYLPTWHGIELGALAAARGLEERPAGPEFYGEFYAALAREHSRTDAAWEEGKRQLGRAFLPQFERWRQAHGRPPSVLALAAGFAHTEGEWLKAGYEVTLNDCQPDSLEQARMRWPGAPLLVGDVQSLQPGRTFDIITAVTLDYVFDRAALVQMLRRLRSWLGPGGEILLYCASTLSWLQMAREVVKRLLGRHRRKGQVFWGWWRTPSEFRDAARAAGLRARGVWMPGPGGLVARPAALQWLPSLASPHLVVILSGDE